MSVQPCRPRWQASEFPTIPAPITTTRALLGSRLTATDISDALAVLTASFQP